MSKVRDEKFKPAHKVIDAVVQANKKICVNLLRYNMENTEISYAQLRIFAEKKEQEKFQQIVFVNYEFEKFIYILDCKNIC